MTESTPMTDKEPKLALWTGTGLPDGSPGLVVRILNNTDRDRPSVVVGFTLTPEEILAALRGGSINIETTGALNDD